MNKKSMIVLVAVVGLLACAVSASAQVRLDVDVPWLVTAGLNVSYLTNNPSSSFDLSPWHVPLPYIELAYQFGDGPLRGGIGLRTYVLLIEFAGWPVGYVELDLKPIVLRAEMGGFAFFLLGAYNDLAFNDYTLRVLIPDVQVSWALTDWFRLGAGMLAVAPLGNFKNFGWLFYVNGRFAFLFK